MKDIYKIFQNKFDRMQRSLRFILNHPLTQGDKLNALKRYVSFHIASRLLPGQIIYPFVDKVCFAARLGQGIEGNIYTGLKDFEEMGLLLHLLREGDLFVDVGANVGIYTLLASGVCKAQTIAIEPIPSTIDLLMLNLRLNDLVDKVIVYNLGVGSAYGELYFTNKLNDLNHVVFNPPEGSKDLLKVRVLTLDNILEGRKPILIKIDVEGFEYEVIKGASKIIQNADILAIILETRGHEKRYGFNYPDIHAILVENNFSLFSYEPLSRTLTRMERYHQSKSDAIYIKNEDFVLNRIKEASPINVLTKTF